MKTLTTLLLALACASQAQAAPASTESVERLLNVMHSEALITSSAANAEQTMRQSIAAARGDRPMSAEEQQSIDRAVTRVVAIIREDLTWAKLKPQFVRLYVDTFEQKEVDGLIAFYATPTGQALVTKMPVVMQKSMVIAQAEMQSLMPKIQASIKESMEEGKQAK